MTAPLIAAEGLVKHFPVRQDVFGRVSAQVQAVAGVSLAIAPNEVLGLAGESGSGKSTIGRLLLRLLDPTAGRISFAGQDVTALHDRGLRPFRRQAQIVFQDPIGSLDPTMTIGAAIAEPLRLQGMANGPELRERVGALLQAVALPAGYYNRHPNELSGGQRQRVVIARALSVDPSFIVADEPVSALDVSIQAQIINLLEEMRTRRGLAMLLISHDIALMEHLCDRIAVLYLGRVMEIGPARDLVRAPRHPYTEALVSAVPEAARAGRRRIILRGDIPNPANPPAGCLFHTRCPYAQPDCSRIVPEMRPVASGHLKACLRDDVP